MNKSDKNTFEIIRDCLLIMLNIGVIGLGYVGLPLFIELEKSFKNIKGFDLSKERVTDLRSNNDLTNEVTFSELKRSNKNFFYKIDHLIGCNIFILCVPTPIFKNNNPNLNYLNQAIDKISRVFQSDNIFVVESTVYPGVTKNLAKRLEKKTKLKINKNLFYGYSPERINPGDNINKISNITKIVSGSSKKTTNTLFKVYSKVSKKLHKMDIIEEAEMAKVIENTQRDVNIALINEIKLISNKLGLNNENILNAAATKWNFHKYTHGLVGGHCISVDPYYLAKIALKNKITPNVILAGRKVNDGMINKLLNFIKYNKNESEKKILICGLTFKENVPDIRNSGSLELFKQINKKKMFNKISLHDPLIKNIEKYKKHFYLRKNFYDIIVFLVGHKFYKENGISFIKKYLKKNGKVLDFKGFLKAKKSNIISY